MRQAAKSGCYELDDVVTLAVTYVGANTTSVSIHVQDSAGGDYSAIQLACSTTSSSHPCTAFSSAKTILAGRKVTVQGLYIKSSAAKGGYESFEIDNITDEGAGVSPAPAAVAEADLERSATTTMSGKPVAANWFQVVSATISDKLVMFDWSPPEFARANMSACPKWFGFGLIPTSAGATPGAACNGTTQPAGQTTVNPKEVLVEHRLLQHRLHLHRRLRVQHAHAIRCRWPTRGPPAPSKRYSTMRSLMDKLSDINIWRR